MIAAILCALGAALSNATGTVMQRRAASRLPARDTMRLALIKHLMRQPGWYAGIGGMIGGFLFQATALSLAGLALVQPIISVELPMTLLIGARVFHRRVGWTALSGMIALSGGLALLITSTMPRGGHEPDTVWPWAWACGISVVVAGGLVVAALAARGGLRAALFGSAAGLAFGFTAALMKGALNRMAGGPLAVATSWQLYAMVLVGIAAVFLTQNALQSGPLAAAQPAITTCEPISSILFGVLLFEESLRAGWWLVPTVLGGGLLIAGSVLLAHSPLSTATTGQDGARSRERQP